MKGIEVLVHSYEKCVEIKGDYIEKWRSCFTLKSRSGWKLLEPTMYDATVPGDRFLMWWRITSHHIQASRCLVSILTLEDERSVML
jgi:hypothetical protein